MNRALLAELQRQKVYPSVTLLFNTAPGSGLSPTEVATATRLAKHADNRLEGDVSDELRATLMATIHQTIHDQTAQSSAAALALCVSPDFSAAVRLGRAIDERVVIDDTFATRDLVADLNRTATYRVVTVSDHRTRLLIGDRQRLIEERNDAWPLERQPEQSTPSWTRDLTQRLKVEQTQLALPTVFAGVERSVRHLVGPDLFDTIGILPGNHDRTSWIELHNAAWPLVTDWLRGDATRALKRLEHARSSCRYAGGVNEVWSLANDRRIELLIVEESYTLAVRLDNNRQLRPADDPDSPDVVDDIIDDTIEVVLNHGGQVAIVAENRLQEHNRIAAILRY